jgi:AraC family transcriptional regulator
MRGPTPITIEAELRAPGILVQVGDGHWDQPLELMERTTIPSLTMLLPQPLEYSEAYFAAEPGAGRFGPVGDIMFAPGECHVHVRASGGPIHLVRCVFEPARFREATGLDGRWSERSLMTCINLRNPRLKEAMTRLGQEALNPGFACATLTEALGLLIAAELGRHFHSIEERSRPSAQTLTDWQMNRIVRYLETLSNHMPDVSGMAELCGISSRHLRRLFKETTDQTIYQYSRDIWMTKAKVMLSDGVSVKEIAYRLGFSDAASFSNAFRHVAGEPPKAFRQQFQNPRANQRHDKSANIEPPIAARRQQYRKPDHMAAGGEPQRSAEPNPVDQQAQEHDRDRERPEADAQQFALLRFRERELVAPIVDHQGAQNEAERGRDDCREAGREQSRIIPGVGGDHVFSACK